MAIAGHAWVLERAGDPLVRRERSFGAPERGMVLLEVLGCGVCHTDLGFADGDVSPVHALPLVLGHEIVGRVIAVASDADEALLGRRFVAPAVSPCGECRACRRGRPTACPKGRMPGNHADGGFATHCYVPARDLAALDPAGERGGGLLGAAELEAWEIAPIADAGTTAWQAIVRAGLREGEVAVFVGAGGVGGFGVQLARSIGARVVAIDVDPARLEVLSSSAELRIPSAGRDPRELRKELRSWLSERGLADATVRVFETSGHPAGQALAFTLLERGGSLSVVGFTPEKIPLRLSNVMALDADVHGNWGCDPALYAGVLGPVLDGRVSVKPFVERRPLDEVNDVLDAARRHALSRRVVLVP